MGTQDFTEAEREIEVKLKYARSGRASELLDSEDDSPATEASGIPVLRTAPLETWFKNLKWMPVSQSAFTPEGRGI